MASRRTGLTAVALIAFILLLAVALRDPSGPEPTDDRTPDVRQDDPAQPPPSDEPAPEAMAAVDAVPRVSPFQGPASSGEIGIGLPEESTEGETTTVRGRLLSADGRPLLAPTVRFLIGTTSGFLTRRQGTVNPDGTFEIPGVPVIDIVDPLIIDAGAEGYLEETYKISRSAFEEGRVEIVLRPPVTISGRLVDEEGRPVAGSNIGYFHGPYVSVSGKTDERGRFSFPSPVNVGLAAYLTHREHPRGILRWPASERDRDLGDVQVLRGRPVRGQVVGRDGKPVPGLTVRLYSGDRFGRQVGKTSTNGAGEFAFSNLGAGPYEVFVLAGNDADGRPLAAREIGLTPGHPPVTLTLRPMVRLTVRFLDAITREPATLIGPTSRIWRRGDPESRFSPRQARGHFTEVTFHLDAPAVYDLLMSSGFHLTERREGIRLVAGEDRTVDLDIRARRGR